MSLFLLYSEWSLGKKNTFSRYIEPCFLYLFNTNTSSEHHSKRDRGQKLKLRPQFCLFGLKNGRQAKINKLDDT